MTDETGREGPSRRTVEDVSDGLSTYLIASPITDTVWIPADDLQRFPIPERKWAIPGVLPQGVALLAGAPKLGKSIFAMNLAVAITTGNQAFGAFEVEQGDVLYCTLEDGGFRRIKTRLAQHVGPDQHPPRLLITTELPRLYDGGLDELEFRLTTAEGACRLVILDTLQRVRPQNAVNRKRSTLYQEDYEALGELTQLAEDYNVSVVAVHHTRELRSQPKISMAAERARGR